MGSVLFHGSACKPQKIRRQLFVDYEKLSAEAPAPPVMATINFRLGEEPENCRVLRYHSVRCVSENSTWVTAEVMMTAAEECEQDSRRAPLLEDAPAREPMRPKRKGWDGKMLDLNLGALKRFLNSRVGRSWSAVLGEIRRGVDGRTFQAHSLAECVCCIVVTNVELVGDQLYNVEFARSLQDSPARFCFYVHPTSGLLQRLPRISKSVKREKEEKAVEDQRPEQVNMDALTKLVRINGVWFVVRFRSIPTLADLGGDCVPQDIILKQEAVNDPSRTYRTWPNKLNNYTVDNLRNAWGAEIYAVSKRQASRRELKRYLPKQA